MGPLEANDWGLILHGVRLTLALFASSFAMSVILGFPIGMIRSGTPTALTLPIRGILTAFSMIVRGVPQLTLLLFVYFGPAFYGYSSSPIVSSLIVLVAFGAVSIGEVVRGAFDSVPKGQIEAGRAIGMSGFNVVRKVVGPQAVRASVPAIVGLAAQLLKLTSITTAIGVAELIRSGNVLAVRNREPLFDFVVIGIVYFVLIAPLIFGGRKLERRLEFEVAA